MKKYLVAIALIIIFLVVSIPLASSNPDGLEKVAATFGPQEHQSLWNGLIANYSFISVGNPYVSKLLAGIFGIMMVLGATLLLGKVMLRKTVKVEES